MKIMLNVDTTRYSSKPKGEEGLIRSRLCNANRITEITPEQLMEAVQQGRSFTPAAMAGTTGSTWQSQQIICADIDNSIDKTDAEGKKVKGPDGKAIKEMLPNPMLPASVLRALGQYGIDPYFMYYSFSNTDDWPKFRVVIVLEEPAKDAPAAVAYTNKVISMLNSITPNCADASAKDTARIFFGGRPGCVFYVSGQTTPAERLEALPNPEPAKNDPKAKQAAPLPAMPSYMPKRADGTRSYEELEAMRRYDIEHFPLAEYVQQTTGSQPVRIGNELYFNPCPICGHNDDFQVTGAIYHCWSDSPDGGTAGTIIDYLQAKHGLDLGEALEFFNGMMKYDPAEWLQAWQRKQDAQKPAQKEKSANEGAIIAAGEPVTETSTADAPKPHNTRDYIDNLMAGDIELFKDEKKTGFKNIDARANGLYAGLYVLAAISSLGKTSFALQLADQLAEAGNDVIFFSLEMSRLELVSKSIARRTVARTAAGTLLFDKAVTSLEIRKGNKAQEVQEAAQAYKNAVADRISVIEGNFNCDSGFIREYVQGYVQQNGVRPVIFVDYLQILQPADDVRRGSTKEAVDNIVTELKRLSRDLGLTIIAISSINRTNYLTPIDFESLKESGSIEFSADVVWGLQLRCLDDPLFDKEGKTKEKREMVKKAKAATPRKIELSCLKNRYGISSYSCYFDYYPANDLFIEDGDDMSGSAWKSGEWPGEKKQKRL